MGKTMRQLLQIVQQGASDEARVDLPVGFRLGVKEKPLIAFLCARPCLDLSDQLSGERDPALSAFSTKGGSAPVGAQAYAVFIGIERLQVGVKTIIWLLRYGYRVRRRQR